MARDNYDNQLMELKNEMLFLGNMIEDVIEKTVNALVHQDVKIAKDVAGGDGRIDEQVRLIEQKCYSLLLKQQPVASDLRAVSAALKMITDMERIGDHGTDISELTLLMCDGPYPHDINVIKQMARETVKMLIAAVDAFTHENKEEAENVIAMDDGYAILIREELATQIKNKTNRDMISQQFS